MIGEINRATRDFACSSETKYVVATGLSFKHFENLTRREGLHCRLYVSNQLPGYLVKAHREAKQRARRDISGDYPEDVPFKQYAPTWIHVRGRYPQEAMDRAGEALDLRRGIWNFALNWGTFPTYPPPMRGPINEVLGAPSTPFIAETAASRLSSLGLTWSIRGLGYLVRCERSGTGSSMWSRMCAPYSNAALTGKC